MNSRNNSRIKSGTNGFRSLAVLAAAGLLSPALFAQSSSAFPTYQVGPQTNGSFVASNGTILTPAGTQVNLGIRVRGKSVAVNPTGNHTGAVLTMGTSASNGNGAVAVFNTQTGNVLQWYNPHSSATKVDASGSTTGINYSPDGKYLLFSQDSGHVTIASVDPTTGMLSDYAYVSVPLAVGGFTSFPYPTAASPTEVPLLSTANCTQTVTMPATGVVLSAPVGTSGSFAIPCGVPLSASDNGNTGGFPTGIAVTKDAKTAYAVLNFNNQLTKIDLTKATPVEGPVVRVGNVPHSVVISPDGTTAYVSNEAGRMATNSDFQLYSNGTPVVAKHPTGSTASGTVSVVNLSTFTVSKTIDTGLHPTGMAFWGSYLLVANTYDDTISVIDTTSNKVVRTISLGLPISVPGSSTSALGASPNSIAVDPKLNIAYVALYNANAIAVVALEPSVANTIVGMIPVGYAPSGVVLDTTDNVLLVANDKGWGTTGNPNPFDGTVAGAPVTADSTATDFGVNALNTHQDLGTVSIVPIPTYSQLLSMTQQVRLNNHWDLKNSISAAGAGSPATKPVAIPAHIGDPSLIKHVFVIIRENRTYDQILGDVAGGNGDASLAVFGDNATYGSVTPNAHTIVQRFPLLDNFYDPSRQSADGHNWIVQAGAPYSDDIQSPDWTRDYPSNGGDPIAYQKTGNLYDSAAKAGIYIKNYGEYIEENTFNVPGCTATTYTGSCEPSWTQFYDDTQAYENGTESQLVYFNTIGSYSPLPDVMKPTVQNYPQFDLGIPDQYRFDVWSQDFANDLKAGKVPALEFMWISSDHTGGPPTAQAMQADNDLALGRFVDAISHSSIWSSSVIFVEEDDAQTGVDHVDGHRSPGYVISPYVKQNVNADGTGSGVLEDSTFYTQVNFTRTIEQILGLQPMNQYDLTASPMYNLFINNPPAYNFKPWTHVPNGTPLTQGVSGFAELMKNDSPAAKALRVGWMKKKTQLFAGKYQKADSEDPDTVNHLDWYEATGFKVPYPGEKKVRPASDFKKSTRVKDDDDGM
jgi:YVTN family beta-propeller protein